MNHPSPPWPTGLPRRWHGCIWSRRWNRCSTRTPTATGRASRRWTRSRHAGSGAGGADWVIDMDIRAFFDTVPWDLVRKAVAHHISPGQQWILLYVERWLKAPLQHADGTLVARDRGTPQGNTA